MKESHKDRKGLIQVLSPLTGSAVPLEQVPDPVFSQKIIGDGAAIIPEDGRIFSPVDGEIATITDSLHAYGLRSAQGLELLIHVGLETVALKGEYFRCHVKAGDSVKAGDLIAEVDLEGLKARGINPITPVLICAGLENRSLKANFNHVTGGKDRLFTLGDSSIPSQPPEPAKSKESSPAPRKSF